MKRRIVSVDGDKGGTGKSMVATACLDVALEAGKKVLLIEADTSNPDVGLAYEKIVETRPIEIDYSNGFVAIASEIHSSTAEIVVISNPARSDGWLEHGRLIADNLTQLGASMTTLWVANRQRDSVKMLASYRQVFHDIAIYFVMNCYWGPVSRFETWHTSALRTEILKNGGEIAFPDIADRVVDDMHDRRMAWNALQDMPFGHIIEAQRVRRIFNTVLSPIILGGAA